MTLVLRRIFFHFQKHHQLFNLCCLCSVELLNSPFCVCTASNFLDEQQIFFKDLIYLFLEREREREREGEKHQSVFASCVPSTGDLAHNPSTCSRLRIQPVTFQFAGWHSTTEPHEPGHQFFIIYVYYTLNTHIPQAKYMQLYYGPC